MSDPEPALAALFEAIDEPVLLVAGSRVQAANAAAIALLGRAIVGHDLRLAIRQPQALQAILGGRPEEIEVGGIGAPGRRFRLTVRPLSPSLTFVRLTDQTAVRAAEQMRVDFVANASHELRTPLATITGYAETLAEDGELPPELRRRFGQAIHDEARRMLRIVSDLMSLSRIEADRFVAPQEEVDPAELARLAADHVRPLEEQRGCTVHMTLAEPLPAITGDFAQLLQLLDNLLSNALRYGCPGPGCEVALTLRAEGDQLLIEVADQGEGMAARHLPRLTERFYRVDESRSRDAGGTGLGLAIVKHIVERHRGTLEIASAPGRGSRFSVRLPLAAVTKA
ncbi:GHKL domain-containing protein [Sphingomonas ginkgonis]|uniref:histidine kinase n=1 Tax=Sphingomonas ginkgonis TaxID=2315330 RepID=A0A429V893_9SPHN|nr:ATP-binding protein [Sphingomonas ginkgonis]RST30193.1 GHKL domain-containing protein [Sphingomonas ginkgonis]